MNAYQRLNLTPVHPNRLELRGLLPQDLWLRLPRGQKGLQGSPLFDKRGDR